MDHYASWLIAAFTGAVGIIGVAFTDLPQVEFSNSTNRCVKVVSKNPNHSCSNLPQKYSKVWVE